jgi:hypothetical protein
MKGKTRPRSEEEEGWCRGIYPYLVHSLLREILFMFF